MSQIRPGILIAAIVFAIFAAYAYLAPATYRTSALLMVESATAGVPAKLPEPLEAARRLSEAVLDRVMLERLARERAASDTPEARAAAASQVRQSLEIDTSDAHTFSIAYRDTNPDRVQRACNDLAKHAAELAPSVLVDRSAERERDLKRQQETQELAAFLGSHPEAAAEAPPAVGQSLESDPALSALNAEKANLEKRLQDLGSGRVSDNPYLDPKELDPNLLRRRLAEINSALSARRDAINTKVPGKVLSPELHAEWKRLLDAVTKSGAEGQSAAPALLARVAGVAPAPGGPIEPNRSLLLFFGVVFGGGLGAAYTLVARATQQRRTKSSRPPSPPPQVSNVTVPLPPAVPTGLGPSVPSYQPPYQAPPYQTPPYQHQQHQQPPPGAHASAAPPIVPVPQRAISSSPPARAEQTPQTPIPAAPTADARNRPASDPPPAGGQPRRFASTLVLPPAENPLATDPRADPVLATAARAWDDEIRAHAVPGFAVVRPGSEPPPARGASSAPPPAAAPVEPAPAHAAHAVAPRSRPRTQMKVTQPLGSFIPELLAKEAANPRAEAARPTEPPRPSTAPRSPVPGRSPSIPPQSQSRYSYVSSVPPGGENTVTMVRPVPANWAPDASLKPELRRPVCEQLYPLAVEGCFIVLVVGVPDSLEQKSRVAAELALALAESGHPRILLMEGDIQSPRVHRLMHVEMPMSAGFSQQLRDRINGSIERRWTVVSAGKVLHVLAEGMLRSPGLLLSRQFSDGLADLRNYYDFIVIDGPSTSLPVESQALDAVANGVVYVSNRPGSPALAQLQALFREKRLQTVVTGP